MLRLDIHPSRFLLATILVLHVTALFLVLQLPLLWWFKLSIECGVVLSFMYSFRFYIIRSSPKTIVKIYLDSEKCWHLYDREGAEYCCHLMPNTTNTQLFIILRCRQINSNKLFSVIIAADSVEKNQYRRLRKTLNFWSD